tara:strand:- start:676 stop:1185 length:510 start_codon:yes stop_codon:yes gene_type:complete
MNMNHPQNMLSYYSDQAVLMRQIMRAQNDALVAQMEEGERQRVSYLTMLQEQQQEDSAQQQEDSAHNHMFTMSYGEIQEAEPLEREADAFVVEEARAEVCECIGCLENQPNQLAHMDPGGCLYDESDEELDWGEDVARPPPPPQLIRETDERISDDEIIVLNGEYIVCG